ncbi:unannotated protein [freshwater metagenome]|uniref:Unannotated protein n=1 Tax=freshwater metagenome TaxID=449393 RepID=A0A6J6X7X1_9ZZZZ
MLQSFGLYLTSSERQRATLSKVTVDAIVTHCFAQGGHGSVECVVQRGNGFLAKSFGESPVAYRKKSRSPATVTARSPKAADGLLDNHNA